MKVKLLLCMMALGALTATAQPPQVLNNGFYLTPSSKHVTINQVKANESSPRCMTNAPIAKRTKARADEPTYQVDFVLDFNTETQKAQYIYLVNQEYGMNNYDLEINQLENGSNVGSVPAGTYDIIAIFLELDTENMFEWPYYTRYVIREQVAIDQDMTLNFAASEAVNHIHFETLTADGETVYTGKAFVDDNGHWTIVEPGNTDNVYYYSFILCPDYHFESISGGDFGTTSEGAFHNDGSGLRSDFFVNDVSDRYAFYCYRAAMKGNDIYTSAYEVLGASGDVTVTNDPTEFIPFEDPFIVPKHEGEDLYCSFSMMGTTDGYGLSHIIVSDTPLSEGGAYKFHVSAATENSAVGYIPIIQPSARIKIVEVNPWGEYTYYQPVLTCPPLVKTNGQLVLANKEAISYQTEFSEELNEEGRDIKEYPFWPKHPVFTTPVEKKIDNLGNNCPLLVTNSVQYERKNYRNWEFYFDYCGRYGETKSDDVTDAKISVKLDGEEIVTGQGTFAVQLEQLLSGVVDATVTNETVFVDDMTGSNKAQLHYTAGAEDQCPPTMTMVQFKAANGDVTDRFATADEGTLEMSAGDFNLLITPLQCFAYNRNAPESVEVSYSPYGEDNWNELAVEEVPENYWPTMGWFYTGSLASVTGQGLNGWFDLKIRLTDAAGNWQEQVLSPAFRIDDHAYSSVATITPSNKSDNAIYNLAGQRMRGDLESLPHGIYIVGGKKVVK